MRHEMRRDRRARRTRRVLASAAFGALALTACGNEPIADRPASADAGATATGGVDSAQPAFGLVTPEQAAALGDDDSITVIDVRTPEEFAEGHLERATEIDFYGDDFRDRISQLDPAGRYLVYCRSGNRSGQATAIMRELGFEQVYDLDGGVVAWSAAGLPLAP